MEKKIERPTHVVLSNEVIPVNEAVHPWLDLNRNGIADYREPAVWQFAWNAFAFLVKVFAPPHTIIARGVNAVETARRLTPPL